MKGFLALLEMTVCVSLSSRTKRGISTEETPCHFDYFPTFVVFVSFVVQYGPALISKNST